MARQNYSRDKQQKELARQRKRQEKLQRKTSRGDAPLSQDADIATEDSAIPADPAAPEVTQEQE